jgi:seryl-tRNA synthetase
VKTGSILTILAGGKPAGTTRTQSVDPACAQQLSFVVSPEKEQLQGGGGEVQRLGRAGRRQARLRLDEGDELRRRRERDRPRAPAARCLVARLVGLGAAAERGRADDADVRALVADLQAQRDATARLEERLERFEVDMRRICASLGLLRTRLVEMSASEEEAAQRELARQSPELRERTDLVAAAMAESSPTTTTSRCSCP